MRRYLYLLTGPYDQTSYFLVSGFADRTSDELTTMLSGPDLDGKRIALFLSGTEDDVLLLEKNSPLYIGSRSDGTICFW